MEVLTEHVHGTLAAPSQRSELPVSPELDRLILACLEKDPAHRPRSADELAAGLAGVPLDGGWSPHQAQEWWEHHCP